MGTGTINMPQWQIPVSHVIRLINQSIKRVLKKLAQLIMNFIYRICKIMARGVTQVSFRRRHHGVEFFVVDLSVAVDVCLLDHGVDLLVAQLLAQVHHHDGQLLTVDEAVTILKSRDQPQKMNQFCCGS